MKWLRDRRKRREKISDAVEAGVVALDSCVPFVKCMRIIEDKAGPVGTHALAMAQHRALNIALGPPYSYERHLEAQLAAITIASKILTPKDVPDTGKDDV